VTRQHTEYTDEERAAYLAMFAAGGKSRRAFAREKGIPHTTLQHWINGDTEIDSTIGTQEKARLEELYDAEIRAALAAASVEGKRASAAYRDLIVAVGILDDKVTRSRGDPTERIEHVIDLDLSRAD